jgi:hypothetical protein
VYIEQNPQKSGRSGIYVFLIIEIILENIRLFD